MAVSHPLVPTAASLFLRGHLTSWPQLTGLGVVTGPEIDQSRYPNHSGHPPLGQECRLQLSLEDFSTWRMRGEREREPLPSGGLKSKLFKPESVQGLAFPPIEKTSNQ